MGTAAVPPSQGRPGEGAALLQPWFPQVRPPSEDRARDQRRGCWEDASPPRGAMGVSPEWSRLCSPSSLRPGPAPASEQPPGSCLEHHCFSFLLCFRSTAVS